MFPLTEIDSNRRKLREMRKSGSDHAMHLKAVEHAIELRRQNEISLHFLKEMNHVG